MGNTADTSSKVETQHKKPKKLLAKPNNDLIVQSSTSASNINAVVSADDEKTECVSIEKGCRYTTRVISALKDYESLDINNDSNKSELIKLCYQSYPSLLDDFIHVLDEHNNEPDLDLIFNLLANTGEFMECNVNKCTFAMRYHRDRHNDTQSTDEDPQFIFYRDLMDQIHCFLYHLYDTGLRIKSPHKKHAHTDTTDDNKAWFDENFASICDALNKTKQQTSYQTNKFSIISNYDNRVKDTFRDGLFRQNVDHNIFMEEEYDSDAIEMDLYDDDEGKQSNIAMYDRNVYDIVKEYVHYNKLHQRTFSIGYRFYYWQFYANEIDGHRVQKHLNEINGGYEIHQLYIKNKYSDIKHEILHNNIFTLNSDEFERCINKVKEYINTSKARKIVASPNDEKELDRDRKLHYNIRKRSAISHNHLLSIILYCDWSELCKKFSATFRKMRSYDTLSAVKEKNREYANWSRLLRETVESFGDNAVGQPNGDKTINV
eukprot:477212_1